MRERRNILEYLGYLTVLVAVSSLFIPQAYAQDIDSLKLASGADSLTLAASDS